MKQGDLCGINLESDTCAHTIEYRDATIPTSEFSALRTISPASPTQHYLTGILPFCLRYGDDRRRVFV